MCSWANNKYRVALNTPRAGKSGLVRLACCQLERLTQLACRRRSTAYSIRPVLTSAACPPPPQRKQQTQTRCGARRCGTALPRPPGAAGLRGGRAGGKGGLVHVLVQPSREQPHACHVLAARHAPSPLLPQLPDQDSNHITGTKQQANDSPASCSSAACPRKRPWLRASPCASALQQYGHVKASTLQHMAVHVAPA